MQQYRARRILFLLGAICIISSIVTAWNWRHRPLPFNSIQWAYAAQTDVSVRNRLMPDVKAMFSRGELSNKAKISAVLGKPEETAAILWGYRLGHAPRVGALFDDWLIIRFDQKDEVIGWRVKPG